MFNLKIRKGANMMTQMIDLLILVGGFTAGWIGVTLTADFLVGAVAKWFNLKWLGYEC